MDTGVFTLDWSFLANFLPESAQNTLVISRIAPGRSDRKLQDVESEVMKNPPSILKAVRKRIRIRLDHQDSKEPATGVGCHSPVRIPSTLPLEQRIPGESGSCEFLQLEQRASARTSLGQNEVPMFVYVWCRFDSSSSNSVEMGTVLAMLPPSADTLCILIFPLQGSV